MRRMPKEEREKLRINIHAARCVNNMQRRLSRNVAAHQPKPRHLNNTSIATLAVYSLYTQHLRVFHGYVHIQYMCVYAWMRTGNGLKCFLRAVKKLKNSRNITTKQQHKKKEKKNDSLAHEGLKSYVLSHSRKWKKMHYPYVCFTTWE